MYVKPKKKLGQHFLADKNIARKIVASLDNQYKEQVLEIGPGTGVLTGLLLEDSSVKKLKLIEIDNESVEFLHKEYPSIQSDIIQGDFLKTPVDTFFEGDFSIIGNFPYNISSQIFFRILEYRSSVQQVVCMIQKEVAERIASGHGSKEYGILSVLLQAYFNVKVLFHVENTVFVPPPKVRSSVIRLTRLTQPELVKNKALFFSIVKLAFNQRRKTLRNSLQSILLTLPTQNKIFDKRPEQLSVKDFIELSVFIEDLKKM